MKKATKSGGQKDVLDKFYTKPEIAAYCISLSDASNYTTIIEPSAGNGSFFNLIENCLAFDLKPEHPSIQEQDWLEYVHPKSDEEERILVIGNPPFGQQNSLAVRFMNHAAVFADRIAFILPISFKKESVQDRIDLNFHLVHEEELPKNSFLFNEDSYDVRCVLQIWDRKDEKRIVREKANLNSNNLFDFVKKADSPEAVIHRIGGRAGKASLTWGDKSQMNHYFIRFHEDHPDLAAVVASLNLIDYPSRDHAVGPRSVGKGEINQEINKVFERKV